MMFTARARKPILMSFSASGKNGINCPMLRWSVVVRVTTATPARIPQNAPYLVARLFGIKLQITAGKSWVTKL